MSCLGFMRGEQQLAIKTRIYMYTKANVENFNDLMRGKENALAQLKSFPPKSEARNEL